MKRPHFAVVACLLPLSMVMGGCDSDKKSLKDEVDVQADSDNDGVLDESDSAPLDPNLCGDSDADSCDDCSVAGTSAPANDGTDTDADGLCDAGDTDDDGDTVLDTNDPASLDASVCGDSDADTCDDCAVANTVATDNDGTDTDADGLCDAGDTDDDGDTVLDTDDPAPLDASVCGDSDADTCDDCSVANTASPANDGTDTDGDGTCDAGEPPVVDGCSSTPNICTQSMRIEAEDFDRYYDLTAGDEKSDKCPTGNDVDTETTDDTPGGGCSIGWTDAGEWLEYDFDIAEEGSVDVLLRVATKKDGKKVRVLIDNVEIGEIEPLAIAWDVFADAFIRDVSLTAGSHVMRVEFVTGSVNFNHIDIVHHGDRIGAEEFRRFSDSTEEDKYPDSCPTGTAVDTEEAPSHEGGCYICWTAADEWLEYDIAVEAETTFDLRVRMATGSSDRSVRLLIDGTEAAVINVDDNDWEHYSDYLVPGVVLAAGDHVIRVEFTNGNVNLKHLEFTVAAP